MKEFIESQKALFQECIDLGKEITVKSQALNLAHSNLAYYFEKIAELYEMVKLPKA